MRHKHLIEVLAVLTLLLLILVLAPVIAGGHCERVDGPVVKAARRALRERNVNYALVWVSEGSEPEIRAAFRQALKVRGLSPAARRLADRYFF